MRKFNVIILVLAFLMSLISVYFGSSIHNAKDNIHVQHLNEMDHLDYYDVEAVPFLSRLAAILTLPFIVGQLGLEVFLVRKSKVRPVKNIAMAFCALLLVLIAVDILTISDPVFFDFSQWGYFWVLFGITIFAGNTFSVFVPGNKSSDLAKQD